MYKILTTNEMFASVAIHPGEMIRDEIEFRGITQKALAESIGLLPSVVSDLLNEKRSVCGICSSS